MKLPRETQPDDQQKCETAYNDLLKFLMDYQESTGIETAQMKGPIIALIMETDERSGFTYEDCKHDILEAMEFYKDLVFEEK